MVLENNIDITFAATLSIADHYEPMAVSTLSALEIIAQ
jgi:hypothetical protein